MSHSCCFIGYGDIEDEDKVYARLYEWINNLASRKITKFYFGASTKFCRMSHKIVSELKKKYTEIERILVLSNYQYINTQEAVAEFEEICEPIPDEGSIVVGRDKRIIDKCDICTFYFDESKGQNYEGTDFSCLRFKPESITKIIYDYAHRFQKSKHNLIIK